MAGNVHWTITSAGNLCLNQGARSVTIPAAMLDDFAQALADAPHVDHVMLLLNDEPVCAMMPVKRRIEIKSMTDTLTLTRTHLRQLQKALAGQRHGCGAVSSSGVGI